MSRKLGRRQQEIIDLMANGWELGLDIGLHASYWLQKGGCGRGGESKHDISPDVVFSLLKLGLIEVNERKFPLETYRLVVRN